MPDSLPPGLRAANLWLDQIRALGIEPTEADIERITGICHMDGPCPGCRVGLGSAHTAGCDTAICQDNGRQRLACAESGHHCGNDEWTGLRARIAEAIELGLYVRWTGPSLIEVAAGADPWGEWVACGPEHPEARPDGTSLLRYADWDPRAGKFVQFRAVTA